jgi:DNA-binding NtrC family response regulator
MQDDTLELGQRSAYGELVLTDERHQGPTVTLGAGITTIGRHHNNHVVLSDRYVSPFHCRIAEDNGQYRLQDLGSRNGTRVNNLLVHDCLLAPGARLHVGCTTLVCRPVEQAAPARGLEAMVGDSPPMQQVHRLITRYAPRNTPVLIVGESGTGKELAARALHHLSPRKTGPFAAVNCALLTPELAASELFGHERGSFTGATRNHVGAFEQAHGGTLFLDEVSELHPRVQAALLRALETQCIRRVGSQRELSLDVRLVAAANGDLPAAVRRGRFRTDLFHRICVLHVEMPPLRHRAADIPLLVRHLLGHNSSPRELTKAALSRLTEHSWPGNVRELRNVLERACALALSDTIDAGDLCFDHSGQDPWLRKGTLQALVEENGGSVAATARALGVPRTTLRDRLARNREQQADGEDPTDSNMEQ